MHIPFRAYFAHNAQWFSNSNYLLNLKYVLFLYFSILYDCSVCIKKILFLLVSKH